MILDKPFQPSDWTRARPDLHGCTRMRLRVEKVDTVGTVWSEGTVVQPLAGGSDHGVPYQKCLIFRDGMESVERVFLPAAASES